MKKLFCLLIISMSLMACNETTKIKKKVKLGPVSITENSQSELEKSVERGAIVYEDFCLQCHMANGKGVPGNFPPLAASNWLTEKRKESIHSVKYGQSGEIEVNGITYDGIMTPMGLSDKEVADVLNYVMNSWGNKQTKMVTVEEVSAVEK